MSEAAITMRGVVNGTPERKRVAVGSGVGAVIETYDFIGFGTAAALYFGTAFFPGSDPVTGTLLSFATLGVGFAARPIGGIIGGHLGDRVGRKPVLVGSLIVMGLATFAIGLLPTYAMVGIVAPILLVIVRIIQGLAFGAEWGGAILMTYEHAPWRFKGGFTGIVQAGFPVGLLLANLVFLVSVHLPGDWAWRVPFLASILLVIVGLIIRAKVPESPVFEDVKAEGKILKAPLIEVIKTDWRNILRGIGLRVAETAGYAISITYLISYLNTNKITESWQTLTALCIAAGIGIFATWGWARLTDKIGRRPLYLDRHRDGRVLGIPDVPRRQHRGLPDGHRRHRALLRRVPERPRRRAGRVVPGTVQREHAHLGRFAGLPDLRDGLRLHALHHHPAVRRVRMGRTGLPVRALRTDRIHLRGGHARRRGPGRSASTRSRHPPRRASSNRRADEPAAIERAAHPRQVCAALS